MGEEGKAVQKQRIVDLELDKLNSALDIQANLVDTLQERLARVITHAPKEEQDKIGVVTEVPLANQIANCRIKLEDYNSNLQYLINNLEI